MGAPPDQVYLCALKKALYSGAELSGYLPLVGKYLVHIRTRTFNMYANAGAGCGGMIRLGGMEQRLCGYAASIEAGAARLAVFYYGNGHAQLCRAQRGHIASGARAYHYQLVFLHKYYISCSWIMRQISDAISGQAVSAARHRAASLKLSPSNAAFSLSAMLQSIESE